MCHQSSDMGIVMFVGILCVYMYSNAVRPKLIFGSVRHTNILLHLPINTLNGGEGPTTSMPASVGRHDRALALLNVR